jgi:putative hydrolase of the HAD superfamily
VLKRRGESKEQIEADLCCNDAEVIMLTKGENPIKAVTFDLWETLLFEKDGASLRRSARRCENLAKALGRFGLKVSVRQVKLAVQETVSSLLPLWDGNKDVTTLDQLRIVVKSASKGKAALKDEWVEELTSAYVSAVFQVRPYLNPDAKEVLLWLKNRGSRVGLICNTGITPGTALRQLLAEGGVAGYFDVMIFSNEVGIRKPDPEIFHLAAQELGVESSRAVHVGDNLRVDIWGAKNAGFRAIHFACEEGKDRIAEADPNSLVARSRKMGILRKEQVTADKTITSFNMITEAIEQLEKET